MFVDLVILSSIFQCCTRRSVSLLSNKPVNKRRVSVAINIHELWQAESENSKLYDSFDISQQGGRVT